MLMYRTSETSCKVKKARADEVDLDVWRLPFWGKRKQSPVNAFPMIRCNLYTLQSPYEGTLTESDKREQKMRVRECVNYESRNIYWLRLVLILLTNRGLQYAFHSRP